MHQIGFHRALELEGVFTHFATADCQMCIRDRLMLLCFGVDAVLLLAVGRFRGKVRDDARAADLSGELDRYLVDYQVSVDMAQRSARLRHDLRNQVQVANALAERGELELAEQHIDAMLKELDGR